MRILAGFAALVLSACATMQTETCSRTCAIALASGMAVSGAIPSSARLTENGAKVSAGASWLTGAASINFHSEYYADGQVILAGTGRGKDGKPAVFGLRVKIDRETPTEAELLVAREGEASLAPPSIPLARDPRFADIVPADKRTSREAMIAAADAYLDGIESDVGEKIPVVESCNRVENGVQTTHSARFVQSGCNSMAAFAYITEVRDRRYPIIDLERGVIVAVAAFNIPGGDYKRVVSGEEVMRHYDPRSLFLFEAFKVVDGKIEQIEATMRNTPLGAKMGW